MHGVSLRVLRRIVEIGGNSVLPEKKDGKR